MPTKGKKGNAFEYNKKGNFKNKNGIWFTPQEKKDLESLVNSVNRKAKRLKEDEAGIFLAENPNVTVEDYYKTTKYKHSDMIFNTKSKSMNRFKSKKEYNRYISALKEMTQRNYIPMKVNEYKKRYIKALEQNLVSGDDNMKDVITKIKNMSWKDYMKFVEQNPDASISYVYDPKQVKDKQKRIRNIVLPPEKKNKKKQSRNEKNVKDWTY